MAFKLTKFLALLLAVVMTISAIYTVIVGIRLWYYSFCIVDSEEFMGNEYATEVYHEMNEKRKALVDENEYSKIICNASNVMRIIILISEIITVYLSVLLYYFMLTNKNKIKNIQLMK